MPFFVHILVVQSIDTTLVYKSPICLVSGTWVCIPVRKSLRFGIVIDVSTENVLTIPVRDIRFVCDIPPLSEKGIYFIEIFCKRFGNRRGDVLSLFAPHKKLLTHNHSHKVRENYVVAYLVRMATSYIKMLQKYELNAPYLYRNSRKFKNIKKKDLRFLIEKKILQALSSEEYLALGAQCQKKYSLTDKQKNSLDSIKISFKNYSLALLRGATGSGKTHVYAHFIMERLLSTREQVLLLVPEVVLAAEITYILQTDFHLPAVLYCSSLGQNSCAEIWEKISDQSIRFVVGTRSSIFLPFVALHYIVVDEEHDYSYKQQNCPFYHVRDCLFLFAHIFKYKILFVSATPSVEIFYRCTIDKCALIELKEQYIPCSQSSVHVIDMKKYFHQNKCLSDELLIGIQEALLRNKQTLLFLNRRGYAPLSVCNFCFHIPKCPHTDLALSFHQKTNKFVCHITDYSIPVPSHCSNCSKENYLGFFGWGVERVAKELHEYFPKQSCVIFSSDHTLASQGYTLEQVLNGDVDFIVGTQVITKGFNFKKLACVGIADADVGLSYHLSHDIRACEKMYQIFVQLSGRTGRFFSDTHFYIQTMNPRSTVIDFFKRRDIYAYLNHECQQRKSFNLPPYKNLASLMISHSCKEQLKEYCVYMRCCAPVAQGFKVVGPYPCILNKLYKLFRYSFLIQSDYNLSIPRYVDQWMKNCSNVKGSSFKKHLDVNPYSFP